MRGKRLSRGLSPIVAVVLLIMITVVAALLIGGFVIPFVRDNLQDSGECFDVISSLEFAETGYNCFYANITSGINKTGFSVSVKDEGIAGFAASLQFRGNSVSCEIINNTNGLQCGQGVKMLLGDNNLVVPKRGETRTYVANGVFDRIEIYPILANGRTCDKADEISLQECTDSMVRGDLYS